MTGNTGARSLIKVLLFEYVRVGDDQGFNSVLKLADDFIKKEGQFILPGAVKRFW